MASNNPAPPKLTRCESEHLRLVAEGKTQPEMAAQLHITLDAVKQRSRHLREKLDATTAAHAVWKAMRWRLLE